MAEIYDKLNITNTYFTIAILDSCDDVYDEFDEKHTPQDLKSACLKVIDLMKEDKELGSDYGVWSYLVVKHEEDDTTDWQTFYKVYKYRGKWKCKRVDY